MTTSRYWSLVKRVEKIALVCPKDQTDNIRNYLFLCGKAHRILMELVNIRTMEIPNNFVLDSIEVQVEELERKIEVLK